MFVTQLKTFPMCHSFFSLFVIPDDGVHVFGKDFQERMCRRFCSIFCLVSYNVFHKTLLKHTINSRFPAVFTCTRALANNRKLGWQKLCPIINMKCFSHIKY